MNKLVTPKAYLIGYTGIEFFSFIQYLRDTNNYDFLSSVQEAESKGINAGEILCSFYAKLCYKSLTLGQNKNITRTRDIEDNIKACFDQGHGSVFEHVQLNFVITDCSRAFTHELVRHRVGTAYSQTSGRYVRGDDLDIVFDPILEPVKDNIISLQNKIIEAYKEMVQKLDLENIKDFATKKKLTSALRRILPNGQSNEIGFSCNLRSLRHLIMVRTGRHAEWEIRYVFNQIYKLTKEKFPLLYHGAKEEVIDDLIEVTGMKLQPYES